MEGERYCSGMLGTDGLQDRVLPRSGGDFKGVKILESSLKELMVRACFENVESAAVDWLYMEEVAVLVVALRISGGRPLKLCRGLNPSAQWRMAGDGRRLLSLCLRSWVSFRDVRRAG